MLAGNSLHCYAGVSRSPAIVIAFIAMTTEVSVDDALVIIQQKRWKVNPDPAVWVSIRAAF
jgi:protein-tyrosine phosphatase